MFNWFFALFAVLYFADIGTHLVLDHLNLREMEKNKDTIPELFKDQITQAEYGKSIAYTTAKTHFSWIQIALQLILVWGLILTGFFGKLDLWLQGSIETKWMLQLAYPLIIAGMFYFISLPFSAYFQFGLEESFGFNKTTPATFTLDQVKTIGISLVIGLPIMALLFYIVEKMGSWWWIGGWGVLTGFQLLTIILFPVVFAPMFYKFTPLEDGELKNRIETLASTLNFDMAGVFTIDGSKRSTHSNAFFAGMGKTRRIVLFDTLRDQLTTDEIESVLAHEIGHNKRNHITKQFILSAILMLGMMFVLGVCLKWPLFFTTFGASTPSIYVGFTLFFLFSSVFTFPLTPAFNYLSRKYEYEADAFSVETVKRPKDMIQSLIKLSKENSSNLTPHPAYSFFHYSHPTTMERAEAIKTAEVTTVH